MKCKKKKTKWLIWKRKSQCKTIFHLWIGESGNRSRLSDTDELGLGVVSGKQPFLIISTFFFALPRFFSNLLVSMEAALRLTDFPGLASGLIIHHDDFPVPSFCTLMNLLCSERLCRIEFWNNKHNLAPNWDQYILFNWWQRNRIITRTLLKRLYNCFFRFCGTLANHTWCDVLENITKDYVCMKHHLTASAHITNTVWKCMCHISF